MERPRITGSKGRSSRITAKERHERLLEERGEWREEVVEGKRHDAVWERKGRNGKGRKKWWEGERKHEEDHLKAEREE